MPDNYLGQSEHVIKVYVWVLEVSNIAPHNFHPAIGLKEEIRNESQDESKIFDPGGIWTHDLRKDYRRSSNIATRQSW